MEGQTSEETLTEPVDKRLAIELYLCADVYGGELLTNLDDPDRRDIQALDTLDGVFSERRTKQYTELVKAIVTVCTALPGHNFSAMLGYSRSATQTDGQTHLFFCQNNEGPALRQVVKYLQCIWKLLQYLWICAHPADDPSINSPDRNASPSELELIMQLRDLVYGFVSSKVLHTAKKRLPSIIALRGTTPLDPAQNELMQPLFEIAQSAQDGDHDSFRSATKALYVLTESARFKNTPGTLKQLQARAQALLPPNRFDLQKWINKLLKIEAAVATLHTVAVSPRHGWAAAQQLFVHGVPLPSKEDIKVTIFEIMQMCQPDRVFVETLQRMRVAAELNGDDRFVIPSHVHTGCQLVAWVAQNAERVAPDTTLIPYMACSKPLCFACFIWLEMYNTQLGPQTVLPTLAYDGSHGGLRHGWRPPSMMDSSHQRHILKQFIRRIDTELGKKYVMDKDSRSSFAFELDYVEPYGPPITQEEIDNINAAMAELGFPPLKALLE